MDDVVILTGFMGTGKSATGRELARMLGWAFVDLDEAIEAEAGRPIPEIFADRGEAFFRDLESAALDRVLRERRVVVAAGGGILIREANRRALSAHMVVNLDAPVEECVRRVRRSRTERPLLRGEDPEARARSLYEARRELYRQVPRRVETEGRSPNEVAREIARRFLGRSGGDA